MDKNRLSGHGCGCCHECGTPLRIVLDGEEWCHKCGAYRRYRSHGWGRAGNISPCEAVHVDESLFSLAFEMRYNQEEDT